MSQVADHARRVHGTDDVPPEVAEKVRLNIRETA